MAIRKIIRIDEDKCNGCGECVTGCAEGALAIIDGKAKLVKEKYCDGFGDCIGTCPTGALIVEERECDDFDEQAVTEHLLQTQGPAAVERMEAAAASHTANQQPAQAPAGGCPGSRMRDDLHQGIEKNPVVAGMPGHVNESELKQWPIQIHLVQAGAPFFKNRELVVMSTCGPLASADVHWRFLRGRAVVVGCPKLDRTDPYVSKLAEILADSSIPKVVVVRMEVPCCRGLSVIVQDAVRQSGRADLEYEEVILGLNGDVL